MSRPHVPLTHSNDIEHRRQLAQRVNAAVTLSVTVTEGEGSPEGVVSAPVGSLYLRLDGGAGTTLYVKESGTGAAGWAAK
jgi:hypothetical protein